MILNAVAELCTIGAVLPLLSLIANSDGSRYPWVPHLEPMFGGSRDASLIAATAIFCVFAILAGILRFALTTISFGFAYELSHEVALEIQRRLLFQPYAFHVQRNTSTLVSTLEKANILVFDVLLPLLQAVSGAFIGLVILAALIAIDPLTAIAAALIFGAIYVLVSRLTSTILARNSEVIARTIDERMKVVQESLGGIRDVIIDGAQATYLQLFDRENGKLARARASTAIVGSAPRFLIETIGIVAIAIIALVASWREGGFSASLPALGAVALGATRLLPVLQQVYRGWSTAAGHLSLVGQSVELLTLPIDDEEKEQEKLPPLPLRSRISMNGVSLKYPGRSSAVLERIDLEVPAGAFLAVTGETGAGKSTLMDLLMGLLEPVDGEIRVDGVLLTRKNRRRWQRSIAHVPQSIFLADATIAQNIALSVPNATPDRERIIGAAMEARLHDFVCSLPAGYETLVGERGIRLSGGQRQRLGLARAIYKDAPVLILDEATNALDERTESAVLGALEKLRAKGRTIIIIAHRPSTIRQCDLIVRLEGGRIANIASPDESVPAF